MTVNLNESIWLDYMDPPPIPPPEEEEEEGFHSSIRSHCILEMVAVAMD